MANLLETLQDIATLKPVETVKTRASLSLAASGNKGSQTFKRVKIDLSKVPSLSAGEDEGPICIDLNVDKIRRTSAGFVPKIIILSGADAVRRNKKNGNMLCDAWIGEKVISSKSNIIVGEVPKDLAASVSDIQMLRDGRNFAAPALGGFNGPNPVALCDVTNFGAPGSELNNPMLKLMLNVEDALAMYQKESADGVHKVIYQPYAPIPPGLINAAKEAIIAAKDAGINVANFSAYDFLKWQDSKMRIKAANRVKMVNGMPLEASAFAYVGIPEDISTWHLPMHTNKAAQRSYNICASTSGVPRAHKKACQEVLSAKLEAAGTPGSGKTKTHAKQPHKFIKEMDGEKCKTCGMFESHALHKVK